MGAGCQRDVVTELLADPLDVCRLVAVGQKYPEDRLGQGRLGRDVVSLLRAVASNDRHGIAGKRSRAHLEYDASARVHRRHALLNLGAQLTTARRAHSRQRHRSKRLVMLGIPPFVNIVTGLLFFHGSGTPSWLSGGLPLGTASKIIL